MEEKPVTEQLALFGSVDVDEWESAHRKRIQLPGKLTALRQKLYKKAKEEPKFRFYVWYDRVYLTTLRVPLVKFTGKPDAGNLHVRFDEGEG